MEEHQQEQHQPSKNNINQARIAPTKQFSLHTIFHSANSKTQANNWRPNAVYKRKKSTKRQWEWHFPAPKLPSPAAFCCCCCLTGQDGSKRQHHWRFAIHGQIANQVSASLQQSTLVRHAWSRQFYWRVPCWVRAKTAPHGKYFQNSPSLRNSL